MNNINTFISEKLSINASSGQKKKTMKKFFPENLKELKSLLDELLKNRGENADLNDIDTTNIKEMDSLFEGRDIANIKIDEWDLSNVISTSRMFFNCDKFNGDLSQWNVSNLKDAFGMFYNCKNFNCDLGEWNVSSLQDAKSMFYNCETFNSDVREWDVSNVRDMDYMFNGCKNFEGLGLQFWNVNCKSHLTRIFYNCPKVKKPSWLKTS